MKSMNKGKRVIWRSDELAKLKAAVVQLHEADPSKSLRALGTEAQVIAGFAANRKRPAHTSAVTKLIKTLLAADAAENSIDIPLDSIPAPAAPPQRKQYTRKSEQRSKHEIALEIIRLALELAAN